MRSRLPPDFPGRLTELRRLLRRQLGLRCKTLAGVTARSRRVLPGHVQAALVRLADDESLMQHPVLQVVISSDPHDADVKLVQKHLLGVDVADRRKGWWLGMAGAMAFNILLLATLIGLAIWWFEPLA